MAELKIRKVDPAVIKKLDELARKKNMSREEYLRRYLRRLAIIEELEEAEERYHNLVSVLAERLEQSNDIIEVNNMLLESVADQLGVRADP